MTGFSLTMCPVTYLEYEHYAILRGQDLVVATTVRPLVG